MTPNPMRWTSALMKMYGKPPYRPDDLDGFNVMLRAYAGCVRDVARKYTVPVVDVYAAFQRYGKDRGKSIDNLLLDGMHPNDRGHRLVADLLIKAILKKVSATDQQGRVDARPARAIH
jgi:lysophospholipase L1-like esterase